MERVDLAQVHGKTRHERWREKREGACVYRREHYAWATARRWMRATGGDWVGA